MEAAFLRYVKRWALPVKVRKMNGQGFRDWPDRLIIGPKSFSRWVEFKRPQLGKVSAGQRALFAEFGQMNHPVVIFDDALLAATWLRAELEKHLG